MNERLVAYSFHVADPVDASALGTGAANFIIPFGATLVYASVSPMEDDSGATMDIQDDGTDIVTAIACATAGTVGEWQSTHLGGSETPVAVAAGSEIELDFNSAAAENAFTVSLLFLVGETQG